MYSHTLRKLALICGVCIALAACKSEEEQAETYFESAKALIAAGDFDRGAVQLRNVFELVPGHPEAREAMAQLMIDRGNVAAAYTNYLRLVEHDPDHLEGRLALSEIAFEARNWEEFARHGQKATELAPDIPRTQVIDLALQYNAAVQQDDGPAQEALAERARDMLPDLPESSLLELIIFDRYVRAGKPDQALQQLDMMIARQPDRRRFYDQRRLLLLQLGDRDAFEAHLRNVVSQFPGDTEAQTALLQYLIASRADDEAEAFLRQISDPADTDPTLFVSLVHFLNEVRGPDAARAELNAALDVSPHPDRLRLLRAMIDFDNNHRDTAIADLQAVVDQAEPSDLTNEIKVALARMLLSAGNKPDAQELVDEVLVTDGNQVEALKIRAAWMIDADDTDAALANLRRALDSKPEDVQALSLTADAYTRAGNHDLARDFMAQAVSVSRNAPEPSLRYARLLIAEQNYRPAEEILLPALRRSPSNRAILSLLGDMYLASEDYGRASMAIEGLRKVGTKRAISAANQLQVQLLARRQGAEAALGFLEQMAQAENVGLDVQIALLRARLSSGQTERAVALAQELVTESPDNAQLNFLLAMTRAATGDLETAKAELQQMLDENPTRLDVWQQLYRILQVEGDSAAASASLEQALRATPDAPILLWARASELESRGDVDAALALYEELYNRNTESIVFANNLASMLATHREDEASLARAWTVARRLRDTDVPAFQDTYGWLAFRQGDLDTALSYLKSAAAGLPEDALAQYHLARVYAALDQSAEAMDFYQRALDLADVDDTRPQINRAREELKRLQASSPQVEN